jgi:hypothetical protein
MLSLQSIYKQLRVFEASWAARPKLFPTLQCIGWQVPAREHGLE